MEMPTSEIVYRIPVTDSKVGSADEDEKTPLISRTEVECRIYRRRWYILAQVAYLAFLQNVSANVWGPINVSAKQVLGFTDSDFILLADWAVIGFVLFIPFTMWQLEKYGVRPVIIGGAALSVLGNGLGCLPLGQNQKYAIHVGQFLLGMSSSPAMIPCPHISNAWFPLSERILATGIMVLFGNAGDGAAFVLGPYLVQLPNNRTVQNVTDNTAAIRHDITTYQLIALAMSIVSFISLLIYFPSKPPLPPSKSANVERLRFKVGIKAVLKNGTFWAILLTFVGMVAPFMAWTFIFSVTYVPKGISEKEAGLISTVTVLSGSIAGMAFSWLADRLRRYRTVLWMGLIAFAYVFCIYVFIISTGFVDIHIFRFSLAGLWVSSIALGICTNTMLPLSFEMAADVVYPVSEGISTSIMMWFAMLSNIVYFSSLSATNDHNAPVYLLLGSMTIALPFVYFTLPNRQTLNSRT